MEDEAWMVHWRTGDEPGMLTGLQEMEVEAWKAHWRTGDGGRSLKDALKDRRWRTKPTWRVHWRTGDGGRAWKEH